MTIQQEAIDAAKQILEDIKDLPEGDGWQLEGIDVDDLRLLCRAVLEMETANGGAS